MPNRIAIDKKLQSTLLCNVQDLVQHVFPSEVCKMSLMDLADDLVKTHHDASAKRWRLWPRGDMPFAEKTATFLNRFAKGIRASWRRHGVDMTNLPVRFWHGNTDFEGLIGESRAPPTLVLWDTARPFFWGHALAIGSVAEGLDDPNVYHPLQGIADAAGPLMSLQPTRLYELALDVHSDDRRGEMLRLVAFDRAGLVLSESFPLHDPRFAPYIVRIVAGMMFAPHDRLGSDATIYLRDDKCFVRMKHVDWTVAPRVEAEAGVKDAAEYVDGEEDDEGTEFEILERTTRDPPPKLHQKATTCYRVRGPDERDYALRGAWDGSCDPHGYQNERKVAKLLGHVEGVADIVASAVVRQNGRLQTTDELRGCLQEGDTDFDKFVKSTWRTHHRALLFPFCEDLSLFRNRRELLHVLCDGVEAIGRLEKRRILHCDISCNNVRLWRPPSGRVRGMLIDLEKACILDAKGGNSDQILTGTVIFFSVSVLQKAVRGVKDDLESLVYVLIYICTIYEGPGGAARRDKSWKDFAISCWDKTSAEHVEHKMALRRNEEGAIDRVLEDFTPYFASFKPLVRRLLLKMGEVGTKGVTCQMLFGILDGARQVLETAVDAGTDPETSKESVTSGTTLCSPTDTVEEKEQEDNKQNEIPLIKLLEGVHGRLRKRSRVESSAGDLPAEVEEHKSKRARVLRDIRDDDA